MPRPAPIHLRPQSLKSPCGPNLQVRHYPLRLHFSIDDGMNVPFPIMHRMQYPTSVGTGLANCRQYLLTGGSVHEVRRTRLAGTVGSFETRIWRMKWQAVVTRTPPERTAGVTAQVRAIAGESEQVRHFRPHHTTARTRPPGCSNHHKERQHHLKPRPPGRGLARSPLPGGRGFGLGLDRDSLRPPLRQYQAFRAPLRLLHPL